MPNQIEVQRNKKVILLFDGHCNLCNWAVQFVLQRNPKKTVQFSALTSKTAQEFLQKQAIDYSKIDSILLVTDTAIYTKSTAALQLSKQLHPIWSIALIGFLLPRVVRDFLYDSIAKNRYQWFGKQDQCLLPSPELQSRFIE